MTEEVWQPDGMAAQREQGEFFNVREAQGHLLIVWVRDEVLNFSTKDCPDGWKLLMRGPNKGKSVPNNVVRATIADLSVSGEDGQPGKIYEEAVIFAGTLVKDLKFNIGKKLLLVWKQHDPSDKSSPYSYMLMNENEQAVQAAQDFSARHPEFWQIPAPAEYKLPSRDQAPPQGVNPPQQPQWQQQPGTQAYPPAQPGYGGPPSQGYGQPQWQQPDPWAQQQPQGNGSFLSRVQGQPEWTQHEPGQRNHHGQQQPTEAPF